MLRNLIDEVRNRRILAFAALGVLVALALPLLFLKSRAGGRAGGQRGGARRRRGGQAAAACRASARHDRPGRPGRSGEGVRTGSVRPAGVLPRRGRRCRQGRGDRGRRQDRARAAEGHRRRRRRRPTSPSRSSSRTRAPPRARRRTTPATARAPRTTARQLTAATPRSTSASAPRPTRGSAAAIPRQKALYIHGKLVAIFVKYSPSRKAAVFAVAPGLHITGPVKCRVVNGVLPLHRHPGRRARLADDRHAPTARS